jgi:hypothetical protein
LNHRKSRFAALRVAAVAVEKRFELFSQAGGWGDRVPRDVGHAAEDRSERPGLVSVDEDLPGRLVEPPDLKGRPFQMLRRVVDSRLNRGAIHFERLWFPAQLRRESAIDFGGIDSENPTNHTDVDHVDHELPQLDVGD